MGDEHWSASSGVPPSPTNDNSPFNIDSEEEADIGDDSEPKELTPTSGKGKTCRGASKKRERNPRQVLAIDFKNRL
jgi:hypothetical protein